MLGLPHPRAGPGGKANPEMAPLRKFLAPSGCLKNGREASISGMHGDTLALGDTLGAASEAVMRKIRRAKY